MNDRSTVARIQFKLPNGVSQNHRFDPENTIGDLYNYVIDELKTPYGTNVSLSTTFPSRCVLIFAKIHCVGLFRYDFHGFLHTESEEHYMH